MTTVSDKMFDFSYKKKKNNELFSSLEKFNISKLQNYLPVYNNYFSLNETNYNNINLNHKFHLSNVKDKESENRYFCIIDNEKNGQQKKKSFFKFSPLLDPIKYMIGKYEIGDNLMKLPNLKKDYCHEKINNINNAAYIDGFFSYLTSQLLNTQKFIHGIDFYGSFIGLKQNFHYNVYDDIDYLNESKFFHENRNKLFKIENGGENLFYGNSRNCQQKINIESGIVKIDHEEINTDFFGNIFKKDTTQKEKVKKNLIFESNQTTSKKSCTKSSGSSSTCSSRSSYTESLDSDDDDDMSSSSEESSEDEILNAILSEFPVNIICLESLENTLDSLLFGEKILKIPEWKSIIFQILIILITYQKIFSFTHNDLHTNNIMYQKTDKQAIYYYINKKYYKIPTYGKIFKLIDFGRAIYKFRDKVICSDSFQSKGDAATQYNFGPCFDKKKPRLEPNFSFDLTRLACSLYDYFVPYSNEERKVTHPIGKLVIKWCKDDRGKNILYKKNGDERYPDFKLYKMIARTVHNHIPSKEIENPLFNEFIISRKSIKKKRIINIDNFEKCFD